MTFDETQKMISWLLALGATKVEVEGVAAEFRGRPVSAQTGLPPPRPDPYDDSGMTPEERSKLDLERRLFASSI